MPKVFTWTTCLPLKHTMSSGILGFGCTPGRGNTLGIDQALTMHPHLRTFLKCCHNLRVKSMALVTTRGEDSWKTVPDFSSLCPWWLPAWSCVILGPEHRHLSAS